MKELRILIFCLLWLGVGLSGYGQCISGSESAALSGVFPIQICEDNSEYTTMTGTVQSNWGFVNKQSDGYVELQMNRDANPVWSTSFELTANVLIEYYNESDLIAIQGGSSPSLRSLGTVDFIVNYDPASGVTEQVLDLQKIPDAYYILATCNSYVLTCSGGGTCASGYFNTISPNITLSAYIEEERAPVSPTYSYTSLSANTTATAGYIAFSWDPQAHLKAVDVEWMWIDANLASGVGSSFKNNASRVRLHGSAFSYEIPDIYEAGHVIFRVRPVYLCGSSYDKECQGDWTISNSTNVLSSAIPSTYPEGVLVSGHEEGLNWTYNLTLAEEGKHKAMVGYADGMLRGRQMVSKINTLDKIVVGESIYDHVGRNAINVLPVPVESSVLAYTTDFTMNESNAPYSYRDFELSQNCAEPAIAPMDKGSGASQYYSDQTASTQEYKDYLPSAHGYPFAATRFENNPLGMVKEQGGLGPVHQVGGEHSTKYYYGQPNQEELDRLFGKDAGYAQNYSKVTTIDANGQRSISIHDMSGNVIATALEGDAPSNLFSLSGAADQLGDVNMMGGNEREVAGKVATSSLEYYLPVEGTTSGNPYSLYYSFRPEKYDGDCELITGLCYDCIYDLSIQVYATECNTGTPIKEYNIVYDPNDYLDENYTPNCTAPDLYNATLTPDASLELEEGYYKIVKTLTLREEAIDFFTDRYIEDLLTDREAKLALDSEAETCVRTLNDFLGEELDKVDWTDCFYTCETCEEALEVIAANEGSGSPEYAEQSELCEAICGGTPCEAAYQSMLADVSPNGQYGLYRTLTQVGEGENKVYLEEDYDFVNGSGHNEGRYSLMNEKNRLPATYFTDGGTSPTVHNRYSWRTPISVEDGINGYVDENGNASLFEIDGIMQGPENFATVEEFIDSWEPSWARSLVFYHPEYLYYEYCQSMDEVGSNDFDEYLLQTATYEDAYRLQLFDPLNENQILLPTNYRADINDPESYTQVFANGDPFFASGGPGNAYRQEMKDAMTSFAKRPDIEGYFSIWQYASYLAYCVDLSDPGDRARCIKEFSHDMASSGSVCLSGDEADMWRYFKALYWQKKQELVSKAQNEQAFNYKGYNGCIGMDRATYQTSQLLHPNLEALAATMGSTHKPTKKKWKLSLSRPFLFSTVYNYRNDPEQTCFEESPDYERLEAFAGKDKRFAHNVYTYLELSTEASTDIPTLTTELQTELNASSEESCDQECEANANQWIRELTDLAESNNLVWEAGETEYDAVFNGLKDFCELHCGQDDYFGSYGDDHEDFSNKMEELIQAHIESPLSVSAHAVIVRAESNRLFAGQFRSYLDDCGCDLLNTAKAAYENLVACNAHEGQSIEVYFYNTYGIEVGNVYDLLCKCESFSTSDLLVEQILVPSGLTCTSCPSCYQLDKVIFDFDCKFSDLLPTASVFNFLDLSNEMKTTFADYANLRLNLHLSAAQYEQALECCDIEGCDIDNTSHKAYYWKGFFEALRDKSKIEFTPEGEELDWNTIDKGDGDFAGFFEHIMCEGTTNPTGLSDDYYVAFLGSGVGTTYGIIAPGSSFSTGSWVPQGYSSMFSLKFIDVQKSIGSPVRYSYNIADITSFNRVFAYKGMSRTRAIFEVSLPDGQCGRVMFEMHYILPTTPGVSCESLDIHNCSETEICSGMGPSPVGEGEAPEFVGGPAVFTPSTEDGYKITLTPLGERTATDYLVDYSMVENANPGSQSFRDGMGQLLANSGINANVSYSECTVNCDDCGASQLSICCGNDTYTDALEDFFTDFTAGSTSTNLLTNSESGQALTVGVDISSWMQPASCTGTNATYTTTNYEAGDQILTGSIAFEDCSSCAFYLYTSSVDFDYADITSVQSLEYDEEGQSSYHSNNFKMVVTTGNSYCLDGVTGTTHTIYGYSTCWELTECASISLVCDRGISLPVENPCVTRKLNGVRANAQRKYNAYIAELKAEFQASYTRQCITELQDENFSTDMSNGSQRHYTLYYYDQARNLVQTVPPVGVTPLAISATVTDDLASYREDPTATTTSTIETTHSLETTYQYNSLGGVREQETPDGGASTFLYDNLGRLVFSQNAKQKDVFSGTSEEHFSYTLYDELGRINEVGQIKINTTNYNMSRTTIKIADQANNIIAANAAYKTEVTKTFYDQPTTNSDALAKIGSQDNMILRVSNTAFKEEGVPTATDYDHASYYNYDIMGNVKTVVQDLKALEDVGQSLILGLQLKHNLKRIDYDYDLISGNVNLVSYQNGEADQYFHRYDYDADNRINSVELSYDGHSWSQDARYQYYDHGSLARTELGAEHVQGMDYAYTLQGWLKAVNGNFLDKQHDMGQDGYSSSGFSGHSSTASDAFGFVLGYYNGPNPNGSEDDYTPVNSSGSATQFFATPGTFKSLYNGNIGCFSVNHSVSMGHYGAMNQTYRYDQLQRLIAMNIDDGIDMNTMAWNNVFANDYKTQFVYDANGNISRLRRFGTSTHLNMDLLFYEYYSGTNKLKHVEDRYTATGSSAYDNDFEDMGTNDFYYDNIGNLVKDQSEEIDTIEWTVYGKVKSVTRTTGSTKANLEFTYDAGGNRSTKTVKNGLQADQWERTYYVRDAAGQLLATYSSQIDNNTTNGGTHVARFILEDQQLYGSARLGSKKINKELFTEEFVGTLGSDIWDYSGTSAGHVVEPAPGHRGQQVRGDVRYELTDHLGNVRSVITDRKLPTQNGGAVVYTPDVVSAQDYYPFGSLMPERQYANASFSNNGYRFGFNGMEREDEWNGAGNSYDFGARIYDPRLGRFLSIDPFSTQFPWQTTFSFAGNNPIYFIDYKGQFLFAPALVLGISGFIVGTAIGLATGQSVKQSLALGAGMGVAGALFGLGWPAIVAVGGISGAGGVMATIPILGVSALAGNLVEQGIDLLTREREEFDENYFLFSGILSGFDLVFPVTSAPAKRAGWKIFERKAVTQTLEELTFNAMKEWKKQSRRQVREIVGRRLTSSQIDDVVEKAWEKKVAMDLDNVEFVLKVYENGWELFIATVEVGTTKTATTILTVENQELVPDESENPPVPIQTTSDDETN